MAEEEPTVVLYGTPLEELEGDEVPGKKSVQDLTVRDEKGRQRFHGAFTGGFSAGYFNTVGTKEGWAPRTFQSSRNEKAYKHTQRPEDYMDAEDLNEFGIAPRRIQTMKNFRDENKTNPVDSSFYKESLIPGPSPLAEIVKPNSQQIGIRLLSSMGWKPGQGIGPRVIKQSSIEVKVYGCSLPSTDMLDDDEKDEYAATYSFAPQDTETLPFIPKDNVNGIGYSGLITNSLLDDKYDLHNPTTTRAVFKTGKKIAIRGQAFGVGALEDDDDDIYAKDDMTQYDFQLSDAKEKLKPKAIKSKSRFNETHLEGFFPASRAALVKKIYLPPKVPADFQPQTIQLAKIVSKIAPPINPTAESSTNSKGRLFLNRHILTADERAQMFGNRFHSMAPEPTTQLPASNTDNKLPTELIPTVKEDYKRLASIASTSDHQFQPFLSQPDKQKRYQIYINMQKEGRTDFAAMQPTVMTEWEKEKEREEFCRASVLFRPLSSGLSNRFESKGNNLEDDFDSVEKSRKVQKISHESQQVVSATFIITEWHPDKLLCKRFNVPNPFPNSSLVGVLGIDKKDKISIFGFLTTSDAKLTQSKPENQTSENSSEEKPVLKVEAVVKLIENVIPQSQIDILKTQEPKGVENKERPSIDFFQAIFLHTDSDSKSEMGDDEIEEAAIVPVAPPAIKSTPTGVFAKLPETMAVDNFKQVETIQELYGPVLPPPLALVRLSPPTVRAKHRKRKHKKEKSHKKKKLKKSKLRSTNSKDDDSSNSEKEIDFKIMKTMKKLHTSGKGV